MMHSLYFNKSSSVYPTDKKEAVTGKKGGGREIGSSKERKEIKKEKKELFLIISIIDQ